MSHQYQDHETGRERLCVRRSISLSPLLLVSLSSMLGTIAHTAWATEPWVDTRQVGPFVCQATFSLDALEPFFAELETLDSDLIRTLGIEAARQPI